MSTLSIEVSLLGGSHIQNVARDMEALSKRLGVMVTANMNGVHLIMPTGGSAAELVKDYNIGIQKAWNAQPHDDDRKLK